MTACYPTAHGTFVVERRYDASPARVFNAWADPVAFRRWYVDGDARDDGVKAHVLEWSHDFRVGGSAGGRFRFGDESNPVVFNDTSYLDLVPDRRIITSYVMGFDRAEGRERFSACLATIDLFADGEGTRLVYTEQGAFFGEDGAAHIPMRERGCADMLEFLGRDLER